MYNEEILDEYRDVLIRKKFQFDAEKIEAALNAIRAGVCVERTVSDWHFPDEDDAVFYEVAMSVEDAYLVTGNIRHFPKVSKVVTPAEMIKIVKG